MEHSTFDREFESGVGMKFRIVRVDAQDLPPSERWEYDGRVFRISIEALTDSRGFGGTRRFFGDLDIAAEDDPDVTPDNPLGIVPHSGIDSAAQKTFSEERARIYEIARRMIESGLGTDIHTRHVVRFGRSSARTAAV